MFHHAYVGFHPGMLIAFNWDEHLRPRKSLFNWTLSGGLTLVPFRIEFRRRVNVVCGRITVGDLQFLINHQAQHVGYIVATVLIELHFACWSGPGVVTNFLTTFN